jgi:hypothetical protein
MSEEFMFELARQIKRHPESFPRWLPILADDVIEARHNVERRSRVSDDERYRRAWGIESA